MTASVALYIAGGIAFATALIHGVVGERRIIGAIRFPNPPIAILSRGMLWVSVAAWAGAGILYATVGWTGPSALATVVILTQAPVLGIGVWGNARATRGRHPGWLLLAASVTLSLYALAAG